jgi:hypothetical protein
MRGEHAISMAAVAVQRVNVRALFDINRVRRVPHLCMTRKRRRRLTPRSLHTPNAVKVLRILARLFAMMRRALEESGGDIEAAMGIYLRLGCSGSQVCCSSSLWPTVLTKSRRG